MPDAAETSTRSRREERRQLQHGVSRSQLLDAAEEIFARKGFHETTLKEVAELAEFSVGSVYSFFQSKDDLFAQVFVRRGDEFMPELRAIVDDTAADPVEALHRLVDFEIGFFREHSRFGRLYLSYSSATMMSTDRKIDVATRQRYDEAMTLQTKLMKRGQKAGVIRTGDPQVLARMFSGLIGAYQSLDPAVVSDDRDATERLALDDLHDIVESTFAVGPRRRGKK